jgi:hypothetical protein
MDQDGWIGEEQIQERAYDAVSTIPLGDWRIHTDMKYPTYSHAGAVCFSYSNILHWDHVGWNYLASTAGGMPVVLGGAIVRLEWGQERHTAGGYTPNGGYSDSEWWGPAYWWFNHYVLTASSRQWSCSVQPYRRFWRRSVREQYVGEQWVYQLFVRVHEHLARERAAHVAALGSLDEQLRAQEEAEREAVKQTERREFYRRL